MIRLGWRIRDSMAKAGVWVLPAGIVTVVTAWWLTGPGLCISFTCIETDHETIDCI